MIRPALMLLFAALSLLAVVAAWVRVVGIRRK